MTSVVLQNSPAAENASSSSPVPDSGIPAGQTLALPIPEIPTQEAIDGIRFDFNDGLRVWLPKGAKSYRVRFVDLDNKFTVFDITTQSGPATADQPTWIVSMRKYYIRFRLIISTPDEDKLLFAHDYDAKGKDVVVRAVSGAIGDTIAWFSYVPRFQRKHQCKMHCVVSKWFIPLVQAQYPEIDFITEEQAKERAEELKAYATYTVVLWNEGNDTNQVVDHRYVGLHKTGAYILGVDDAEEPPQFDLSAPRQIPEKYVCIAVQASALAKMWNHPTGWREVVAFLQQQGYRVLCIDKERFTGIPGSFTYMPEGAEDFTGDRPLQERINLIKDADFFIGLSSGLSWVAWGCKVPVVMISGFTHPTNEFATPYRVINYHTCHSCWNDMRENFDHFDFLWCPRHTGDDRQFECTRLISPEQVIATIKKIPSFKPAEKKEDGKSSSKKNAPEKQ